MNRRTPGFRAMFDALERDIQEIAALKFRAFKKDPNDPALHNHPLKDGGRGQHRDGSRSVRITRRYRAIYVVDGRVNVWYWIGSHSDYNIFTGSNS